MLKLPKVPYIMDKNKRQVVSMGNINYSKMTNDGDIADSGGVSGRHFPLITTARGKGDIDKSYIPEGANEKIDAIAFFGGEFVYVKNSKLFYGGREIGDVLPGEKQFAAVNTKLVIMPDKKFLDVSDLKNVTLKNLGALISLKQATFEKNSVKLGANIIKLAGVTFSANEKSFTAAAKEVYGAYGGNTRLCFEKQQMRALAKYGEYRATVNGNTITFMTSVAGDVFRYTEGMTLFVYAPLLEECGVYKITKSESTTLRIGTEIKLTCKSTVAIPDGSKNVKFYTETGLGLKTDNCVWLDLNEGGRVKERYAKVITVSGEEWRYESPFEEEIKIVSGSFTNGGFDGDFREMIFASKLTFAGTENNNKELTIDAVDKNRITFTGGIAVETVSNETEITIFCDSSKSVGFKVDDVVSIRGCSIAKNNIDFRIDSISEDGTILYAAADIFEPSPSTTAAVDEMGEENGEVETVFEGLTIERRIPTLDYICESDNRLYGCSNEDNTIYVSALGDPTNIYAYRGISTDSYAVAVASEEPFTGCCPYDGGVLFWKENKLHKLLGSYPAEYALYTYNIDGVQKDSHKSLQNIGEVLYYKGVRGVFAFNGSPQLISSNFGDKYFKDAVAGSDGDHYLISMKSEDGGQHFFSFDTRSGLWVREGSDKIAAFTRKGNDVYMLEDGKVYVYGAEETPADAEWYIRFTPIYETIEGQKSYSRIKLRVELPRGSYIVISVRCDGGRWVECGKIVGRVDGVIPVMVPINRCDKFELKIEGKGPCTIHSILREYFVGGDR